MAGYGCFNEPMSSHFLQSAVQVRTYVKGDFDACMVLASRLTEGTAPWRDTGRLAEVVSGWVSESLNSLPSSDAAAFVAEAEDVVGFVTVARAGHFSGQTDAYVGELAVAEYRSGQGIGSALMLAAEQWGREQGLERIILETGARNTAARDFYTAIGYQYEEVKLSRALSNDST